MSVRASSAGWTRKSLFAASSAARQNGQTYKIKSAATGRTFDSWLRSPGNRLLVADGQQGARLCHLVVHGSYTAHIARAVERIRQDYDQPLRIEELARELGMSVSGRYHCSKAVMAMSPLQFQKQLVDEPVERCY